MNELEEKWAELDRRIDRSAALGRRALNARGALARLAWEQGTQALLTAMAVLWIGSFEYEHRGEPRYLAPALALHAYAVLLAVVQAAQLALTRGVRYDAPLVETQRRLARLRDLRSRSIRWTLLTAPLAWTPLFVVALRGLLGQDAYRAPGPGWLAANLAFGVAFVPLAWWLGRRYADRPWMRRFARHVVGENLSAASGFFEGLEEFERKAD